MGALVLFNIETRTCAPASSSKLAHTDAPLAPELAPAPVPALPIPAPPLPPSPEPACELATPPHDASIGTRSATAKRASADTPRVKQESSRACDFSRRPKTASEARARAERVAQLAPSHDRRVSERKLATHPGREPRRAAARRPRWWPRGRAAVSAVVGARVWRRARREWRERDTR